MGEQQIGQYRDVDGVLWWDTATACAQLRVQPRHLWDWVRRSKRGDPGFPRVDPPVRDGNTAAYRAQQLIEAEAYTAAARHGRVRRAPAARTTTRKDGAYDRP